MLRPSVAEALESNLITPYAREFGNRFSLFWAKLTFFRNTVLASSTVRTLRNIPTLFTAKKTSINTLDEVFEADRGLL